MRAKESIALEIAFSNRFKLSLSQESAKTIACDRVLSAETITESLLVSTYAE